MGKPNPANTRQAKAEAFAAHARELGYEVTIDHERRVRDDDDHRTPASVVEVLDPDGGEWYSTPTRIWAMWMDSARFDSSAPGLFRDIPSRSRYIGGNISRRPIFGRKIERKLASAAIAYNTLNVYAPPSPEKADQ